MVNLTKFCYINKEIWKVKLMLQIHTLIMLALLNLVEFAGISKIVKLKLENVNKMDISDVTSPL